MIICVVSVPSWNDPFHPLHYLVHTTIRHRVCIAVTDTSLSQSDRVDDYAASYDSSRILLVVCFLWVWAAWACPLASAKMHSLFRMCHSSLIRGSCCRHQIPPFDMLSTIYWHVIIAKAEPLNLEYQYGGIQSLKGHSCECGRFPDRQVSPLSARSQRRG
jgi:hypothetical protein